MYKLSHYINEAADELVLTMDPKEQMHLIADLRKHEVDAFSCHDSLLTDLSTDSELEIVLPEWVGALTSAPMLGIFGPDMPATDDMNMDHVRWAGAWDHVHPDGVKRHTRFYSPVLQCWAYMNYKVRDWLEDLLENGYCVWQSGGDIQNKTDNAKKED